MRFDVLRSVEDPPRFVLYEWYANEAAALAGHKGDAALRRVARARRRTTCSRSRAYGVRYEGLFPETAAG